MIPKKKVMINVWLSRAVCKKIFLKLIFLCGDIKLIFKK